MDDQNNQLRELLGSVMPPTILTTDAWTEKHGVITEPIQGVLTNFCIALTKGDLIANAKAWKDHTSDYSPQFVGLILLILSCEWTKLGSLSINVSPDSEAPLYNRVVKAIARKILGWAKSEDYALIDQYVVGSRYVNMKHQRDIRDMKEWCQTSKDENPSLKKTKKKKDEEELEEPEEEENPQPDLSDSNIDFLPINLKPIAEQFSFIVCYHREPRVGAVSERCGEIMDTLNDAQLIFDNHDLFKSFTMAQIIANDIIPQPSPGTMVLPKCTTTFTAVKNAEGATIGYLVQFLQHDPSWNPGKMLETLNTQIDLRGKNRTNPRYVDPWPQYISLLGTDFPVHTLTHAKWVHIVNCISGATADMGYEGSIEQYGKFKSPGDYSSRLHPCNVFNLRSALMRLSRAGGVVYREEEYYDSRNKVAMFPHAKSYRFFPEQVFWDDLEKTGFSGKYFPGHEILQTPLNDMLGERPVVLRSEIMKHIRCEGYRTNNLLIYYQREADSLYEAVQSDPEKLRIANAIGMDKIVSLCQLEGSTNNLPLSPSMRASLVYLQSYAIRNPHITRELILEDPSLGLFANAVIKDLGQYSKEIKIIHPLVSFLNQGLLSVAQRRIGQILFSLSFFSEFGMGKSFMGPGFVRKLWIPGTWVRMDRSTDASDQTDQGTHDEIRTYDELDEVIVNADYAKKHPEKANLKKTAVVEGEICIKTFEKRTIQGVGEFRANRSVQTALNYVEVGGTNNGKINKDALGSRYYQKTIKGSNIPPTELNYKVDPDKRRAALDDFRVYQAISYWCEKSMAVFAMCREPNMQLWYDVMNRIFEYLNSYGIIDIQRQARILEIMTPFCRQMVLKYAYHCTFNVPGGAGYHKIFHPTLIKAMEEHLYVTLDVILFVLTLLSNEIIDEDMGDVLEAAYHLVTGKPTITTGVYQLYRENPAQNPAKIDRNPNHNRDSDGKLNKSIVDLNYLQISSDLKTVASQIAPLTKSKISATDVEHCLRALSEQHYTPIEGGRNGYHPMPCDDMSTHRVTRVPKHILRSDKHMDAINAFVIEIKDTLVHSVVSKLNRNAIISYHTCKSYMSETMQISDGDIVFLYYMREHWVGTEQWRDELMRLKARSIMEIERTALERVTRSFFNSPDHIDDPYMQAQNLNLTFQQCQLILFAFERGFIMEVGSPSVQYERRHIVRDPEDIQFPHYISEDDIPQIYANPVSKGITNHSIRIVEFTSKRVCFSPAAANLFNRNMILDAFIWATFCESTKPGKRLLGWEHPEDPTKALTVTWDQAFINSKIQQFNAENPKGVNRLNGVVFKRRGIFGIETVYDLDKWSAQTQREICGIKTPMKDLLKGCKFGNIDYPNTYLEQQKKVEETLWRVNSMNRHF
jgi:hypothetical protein